MKGDGVNRSETSIDRASGRSPWRSHDDAPTIIRSQLARQDHCTREPHTFFELQFSTRWWLRFFDATTPERASALLCSGRIAPRVLPGLTMTIYTDIQDWASEHGCPTPIDP
jgi:hypothetical protein